MNTRLLLIGGLGLGLAYALATHRPWTDERSGALLKTLHTDSAEDTRVAHTEGTPGHKVVKPDALGPYGVSGNAGVAFPAAESDIGAEPRGPVSAPGLGEASVEVGLPLDASDDLSPAFEPDGAPVDIWPLLDADGEVAAFASDLHEVPVEVGLPLDADNDVVESAPDGSLPPAEVGLFMDVDDPDAVDAISDPGESLHIGPDLNADTGLGGNRL